MNENFIGNWVEIILVNGSRWIGKLEEWDEDALTISNGNKFGQENHKGAECTNEEAAKVSLTDLRELYVE